jgi:hypothetical protein
LTQIYDGSARVVSATTTPEGLSVTLSYAGSASAPTNVGSYEVIGTVADANYVGSTTNTLSITPASAVVYLTVSVGSSACNEEALHICNPTNRPIIFRYAALKMKRRRFAFFKARCR